MGKRSRKSEESVEKSGKANGDTLSKNSLLSNDKAVDPSLALLFASSSGPVKAPPKSRYEEPPPPPRKQPVAEAEDRPVEEGSESERGDENGDEELSSADEDIDDADVMDLLGDEEGVDDEQDESSDDEPNLDRIIEASKPERKRKRKADDEDLEGKYLQKLAKEEEREEEERQAERRLKRQKLAESRKSPEVEVAEEGEEEESDGESDAESSDEESSPGKAEDPKFARPADVPIHESLAPSKDDTEIEKASRTVFLANVTTEAIISKSAKKTLLAHMSSFLSELPAPPEGKPPHKVESLRFRSTAYAGTSLPKKAAFVKQELMPETTKSTNAYVVYSTAYAAREAVKRLNGSIVLDRHLRVDGVAHPAKTDHRRCVFVGNLGFVDDESLLPQDEGENARKRSKVPSDIEEGLWRQFGKAGKVESVRVVRDEKTRVGKGFAYVQFEDPNAVEAALLFNEKKYPPMLPRVLRVVRAKALRKTALANERSRSNVKSKDARRRVYNPKVTEEQSSLQGRASKLLGRAGAAKLKSTGANDMALGKRGEGGFRTPEKIVFEGHRASSKNKPKLGGKSKKGGKPVNRAAKRASAWKKNGAKVK